MPCNSLPIVRGQRLSNLKVYVESFPFVYTINSGINHTPAEDVYFNGNVHIFPLYTPNHSQLT